MLLQAPRLFLTIVSLRRASLFQRISLALLRSDYLADSSQSNSIKQVEINTIASSFAGVSRQICSLHRYVYYICIFIYCISWSVSPLSIMHLLFIRTPLLISSNPFLPDTIISIAFATFYSRGFFFYLILT